MSKINFTKLGLKKTDEIKTFTFNDNEIEVKQYLPVNEKIELLENVVPMVIDDNNFLNQLKLDVYVSLYILYYYTNITFTEKQKEDAAKLYDLCEQSGLINAVIENIPELEYTTIIETVQDIAESYLAYKNSAYGIMDALTSEFSSLREDTDEIASNLSNPENLTLLKEVVTKLG